MTALCVRDLHAPLMRPQANVCCLQDKLQQATCSFVAYIIGQTATQYQRQHAFGPQKDMKSAMAKLQAYIVSHVITQLQVVCHGSRHHSLSVV